MVPPFRCLRLRDRASCACTLFGRALPSRRNNWRAKVAAPAPARPLPCGTAVPAGRNPLFSRNLYKLHAHAACSPQRTLVRLPVSPSVPRRAACSLSRTCQSDATDSAALGARRAVAVHRLLQHLAGLEGEDAAPGDDDLLAGLRVPPLARALLVDDEVAEAGHLHL